MLYFYVVRLQAPERHALTGMRVINESHPEAVTLKLNCFEGSIESLDKKTKERFHRWNRTKCYNFSLNSRDRDNFTYPIHIAAENGYKVLDICYMYINSYPALTIACTFVCTLILSCIFKPPKYRN